MLSNNLVVITIAPKEPEKEDEMSEALAFMDKMDERKLEMEEDRRRWTVQKAAVEASKPQRNLPPIEFSKHPLPLAEVEEEDEQEELNPCDFCSNPDNVDKMCEKCPLYPLVVLKSIEVDYSTRSLVMIDMPRKWKFIKYFLKVDIFNKKTKNVADVYGGRYCLFKYQHLSEKVGHCVGLCQRVPTSFKKEFTKKCTNQLLLQSRGYNEICPEDVGFVTTVNCDMPVPICVEERHLHKVTMNRVDQFFESGGVKGNVELMEEYFLAKNIVHIKTRNLNGFSKISIPKGFHVFYSQCLHNDSSLNELFNFSYWDRLRRNRSTKATNRIKNEATFIEVKLKGKPERKRRKDEKVEVEAAEVLMDKPIIDMHSKEFLKIINVGPDESKYTCDKCNDAKNVDKCPDCPEFDVVLSKWSDGYGCWIAQIMTTDNNVMFPSIKFFKTAKLINNCGMAEVSFHSGLPYTLIMIDPPSRSQNETFKEGMVVGTCQISNTKKNKCKKRRLFHLEKSITIQKNAKFILQGSFKPDTTHQLCYDQRHIQRIVRFSGAFTRLRVKSLYFPCRKSIRITVINTGEQFVGHTGDEIMVVKCGQMAGAIINIHEICEQFPEGKENSEDSDVEVLEEQTTKESGEEDVQIIELNETSEQTTAIKVKEDEVKESFPDVLINKPHIDIHTNEFLKRIKIRSNASKYTCTKCNNAISTFKCPNCPEFDVVLSKWSDGYGCWIARIMTPDTALFPSIRFFKTANMINDFGMSEVSFHSGLPYTFIMTDHKFRVKSEMFKEGMVVGTCQISNTAKKNNCKKHRIFYLNKTITIPKNAKFILQGRLKPDANHQLCYEQMHIQKIVCFLGEFNRLRVKSRFFPCGKMFRMTAINTGEGFSGKKGDEILKAQCSQVTEAIIQIHEICEQFPEKKEEKKLSNVEDLGETSNTPDEHKIVDKIKEPFEVILMNRPLIKMGSNEFLRRNRIDPAENEYTCVECNDAKNVDKCPNCPEFNVTLTKWNDGYGCWIAKIMCPENAVLFPSIKFFKTVALINESGMTEVSVHDGSTYTLIMIDPPSKAQYETFKEGMVVGTCQISNTKRKKCSKRRVFHLDKTIVIPKNATFVLQGSFEPDPNHQLCYDQRHIQRIVCFSGEFSRLRVKSRYFPHRKSFRITAINTGERFVGHKGDEIVVALCASMTEAIIQIHEIFEQFPEPMEKSEDSDVEFIEEKGSSGEESALTKKIQEKPLEKFEVTEKMWEDAFSKVDFFGKWQQFQIFVAETVTLTSELLHSVLCIVEGPSKPKRLSIHQWSDDIQILPDLIRDVMYANGKGFVLIPLKGNDLILNQGCLIAIGQVRPTTVVPQFSHPVFSSVEIMIEKNAVIETKVPVEIQDECVEFNPDPNLNLNVLGENIYTLQNRQEFSLNVQNTGDEAIKIAEKSQVGTFTVISTPTLLHRHFQSIAKSEFLPSRPLNDSLKVKNHSIVTRQKGSAISNGSIQFDAKIIPQLDNLELLHTLKLSYPNCDGFEFKELYFLPKDLTEDSVKVVVKNTSKSSKTVESNSSIAQATSTYYIPQESRYKICHLIGKTKPGLSLSQGEQIHVHCKVLLGTGETLIPNSTLTMISRLSLPSGLEILEDDRMREISDTQLDVTLKNSGDESIQVPDDIPIALMRAYVKTPDIKFMETSELGIVETN